MRAVRPLDLLFPRSCPWCGRVLGFVSACRCAGPDEHALPAAPLPPEAVGCNKLDGMWAAYHYRGVVRQTVHRLKFLDGRWLARPLGDVLAAHHAACGLGAQFDLLVPVPVSRKTQRQRGYNQSALMARRLAQAAGLPCTEALAKVKETRKQMDLSREERLSNVLGAYALRQPGEVAGKRVLLVDDVLTTGSTAAECARTLREGGAECAGVLCLSVALPAGVEI